MTEFVGVDEERQGFMDLTVCAQTTFQSLEHQPHCFLFIKTGFHHLVQNAFYHLFQLTYLAFILVIEPTAQPLNAKMLSVLTNQLVI
jgi:hypothetical protein